jgi:hypothetical protein
MCPPRVRWVPPRLTAMPTCFARASTERSVPDAHDGGDTSAELRRGCPRLFAPDRREWAVLETMR